MRPRVGVVATGIAGIAVVAWAACSSRSGPDTGPTGDADIEVPGADDAVGEVALAEDAAGSDPGGPVVPPACDPQGPDGPAIPIEDLFTPESETRPFPNLALARNDPTSPTGFRLVFETHPMRELLNHLDGFGATAPFVVPLPFEPDPESLVEGVFLVRTGSADDPETDPARLTRDRVPIRVGYNADAQALVAEPALPLAEREPCALVVTRCVRDDAGRALGRAAAMERLADAPPDHPLAVEMARARRYLSRPDVNLPEDAVALVLPTVVRSTASRLRALLADPSPPDPSPVLEWAMPPALPDGTLDPEFLARVPGIATLMDEEFLPEQMPLYDFGAIGVAAMGRFTVRRYVDPVAWVEAGGPVTGFEDLSVRFFLTLPSPGASAHPPPFPVVVFQHAFGVCKETAVALAGAFSREGLALLAVDAVGHGDRGKGQCPSDPASFLAIGEPLRLWYNFAESALETAQAARIAQTLDLDLWPWPDGDGSPDLRPGEVGLVGQSMGAFLGAVVAGVEDGVGPVVLNVGGGQEGLFFAWGMSAMTGLDPWVLSFANVPGTALDIMGPVQAAMDDVEPLVFAAGTLGPQGPVHRHVLMQQAVEDEVVPAEATARLARVLGLARLVPGFRAIAGLPDVAAPVSGNLPGGRTAVLAQFSPAQHAFLLINDRPDQDPDLVVRAQSQAARFLRSFFDGVAPTVVDPYAPGPLEAARGGGT